MIIDTHIHMVGASASVSDLSDKIKRVEDVVSLNVRYPELMKARLSEEPIDISDQLFEDWERHGIAGGVVQITPGRATNDTVAQTVADHAGVLYGLINLRGFQVSQRRGLDPWTEEEETASLSAAREWAAREIERCVEVPGMVGIAEVHAERFTVSVHPEAIARDFKPFMDMAARYKLPIQIATGWSQFPGGLYYADPVWTDEIAGRYPEVPIILTKMGRGLHYFDNALAVAMRNTNVYFDTVSTTGEHVRVAVDKLGAHRVMFGSDWSPTWRWVKEPMDLYGMRMKTLNDAGLTPTEREQVECRTAEQVFGLG